MHEDLIKRLRNCISDTVEDCAGCPYQGGYKGTYCMNGLISEAADAIEELQKQRDEWESHAALAESFAQGWIPVTERLPEEMDRSCGGWSEAIRPSVDVLVWLSPEERQSVAWYSYTFNEWTTVDENTMYHFEEVTHWMSLPESPKEEA